MKKRKFRLTPQDIKVVRDVGGPTFSPRCRNEVVCNQLPHLGRFSPKQAQRIRNICWPHQRNAIGPEPPIKVNHVLKYVLAGTETNWLGIRDCTGDSIPNRWRKDPFL